MRKLYEKTHTSFLSPILILFQSGTSLHEKHHPRLLLYPALPIYLSFLESTHYRYFFYPPLFWQKPLFFEMVHVIRTGNCISTHCFYMKMLKYMRVVYLEYNFFFYFICRIIKSNYFIYEMIFIHGISFIAFTSFNICNYKIVGRHM